MNSKNFWITVGIVVVAATMISLFSYKRGDDKPYGAESSPENQQPAPGQAALPASPGDGILPQSVKDTNGKNLITIETKYGKIKFATYDGDAPKTVANFVTLANKGFYDNLTFHRVIKGFMIQGGDPNGNGSGGPGYTFADELDPGTDSYKAGYQKGVVAMANAGPDTNGSQFFIMLEDYPLPNNYTIFGKVVEGQDVVDKIGSMKTGSGDKPLEPVVMKKITVEKVK